MSTRPTSAWPPFDYRLGDAGVSVRRLPAHGLAPLNLLLAGSGRASFEHDGKTQPFALAPDVFLPIVNALYQTRFFDLPDRLLPRRSIFLKDDGSVGTQATRMHDAATTIVCFTLPQFQKCVSYELDAPPELEQLVQRLLADARKWTAPAAPSK
ncbi:MAG: hypothetical protein ABI589_05630 [Burkholderiales bacterium]